jgi:hypothetical protein
MDVLKSTPAGAVTVKLPSLTAATTTRRQAGSRPLRGQARPHSGSSRRPVAGCPARLPLGHPVEHWFDVDDRGAVERFELADLDPQALDGEDLGPVHADRVGPVG